MLCQPSVPKKRVHTGAVLGTGPGEQPGQEDIPCWCSQPRSVTQ